MVTGIEQLGRRGDENGQWRFLDDGITTPTLVTVTMPAMEWAKLQADARLGRTVQNMPDGACLEKQDGLFVYVYPMPGIQAWDLQQRKNALEALQAGGVSDG